jgi:hypothetical protein
MWFGPLPPVAPWLVQAGLAQAGLAQAGLAQAGASRPYCQHRRTAWLVGLRPLWHAGRRE